MGSRGRRALIEKPHNNDTANVQRPDLADPDQRPSKALRADSNGRNAARNRSLRAPATLHHPVRQAQITYRP